MVSLRVALLLLVLAILAGAAGLPGGGRAEGIDAAAVVGDGFLWPGRGILVLAVVLAILAAGAALVLLHRTGIRRKPASRGRRIAC